MSQELLSLIQTIGVLAAVYASFSAYRARDNQKTATLTQMQADIRTQNARLRALETTISRAHTRRAPAAQRAPDETEARAYARRGQTAPDAPLRQTPDDADENARRASEAQTAPGGRAAQAKRRSA